VGIDCGAPGGAGRDGRPLARVLLRIYQDTHRRDAPARAAIRKRVDVLLAGGPKAGVLSPAAMAIAAGVMLLVLPWLV